jgi:hypothetical protein
MKSRTRMNSKSRFRLRRSLGSSRGTRRVARSKTGSGSTLSKIRNSSSKRFRIRDWTKSENKVGRSLRLRPSGMKMKSFRTSVGTSVLKPRLTLKKGYTRWQVEHQSIGVGPLRKGKLEGWHSTEPKATRLNSIDKAVKKFGALSTYRSLNALAVLGKNRQPETAEVAKEDRDYVRKRYFSY